MTNPQDDISRRLRPAREAAGVSTAAVAAACAVKERTVERWERGEIDIPASRLAQYARALGTTVDRLLRARVVRRSKVMTRI